MLDKYRLSSVFIGLPYAAFGLLWINDPEGHIAWLTVLFIALAAKTLADLLVICISKKRGFWEGLKFMALPLLILAWFPLQGGTGTEPEYARRFLAIGLIISVIAEIPFGLLHSSRPRGQQERRQRPTTGMWGLTWSPQTYEATIEDFRQRRITGEVAIKSLYERYEWLLKQPDAERILLEPTFERSKGQLEQLIEEQQPAQAGQERDNTSPPPLRTQTLAGLRQVSQREPEQAPPNEELPRLRRRDPEMPVMTFEQTLAAFERDEIDWYAAFAQMNRYNERRMAEGVDPPEIIRAYSEAMRRLAEADRRKNGSAGERAQGAFGRIREDQIQRARESWMPPKREDLEREPAPTIYDPQTVIDLYNGDQMTFEEADEAISRWVGQHTISRIQSGRNAVQELEALRQRREDDQARVQTPPSGDDIESTGNKAGEGDSR